MCVFLFSFILLLEIPFSEKKQSNCLDNMCTCNKQVNNMDKTVRILESTVGRLEYIETINNNYHKITTIK